MKALEAKGHEGSFGECAEVYYDSLIASNPSLSPKKAAAQAINRARRIFRAGGLAYAQVTPFITNTQPMNYLEQKLIYENMNDTQRRILFLGGITIRNFYRLAEERLTDFSKIFIPKRMPMEILLTEVKEALS